MVDLSISLVSCNSKDLLFNCLQSIYRNTKRISFEIFLTDNGSTDGTVQMIKKNFPTVVVTANKTNALFTKAHNQNLRRAKGKYFLVLNEDTYIPRNALKTIVQYMEAHPKVGLASCRQVDENGKTNITSERFPKPLYEIFEKAFIGRFVMRAFRLKKPKKMLEYFRYGGWDRTTTRQVDVIPGSFFLGRRSLLTTVGFFDENLLLYYEEPDYCQRARNLGYLTYHVGSITIVHYKTKTIAKLSPIIRYQIAEHDMLAYYKKYFGFVWWAILWFIFRPNCLYWKLRSFRTTPNEI